VEECSYRSVYFRNYCCDRVIDNVPVEQLPIYFVIKELTLLVRSNQVVMLRINKQAVSRSESNETLNNYRLPEAEVLSRQDMATPRLKRANPATKIPVPVQNKLL
jgi:hypothetical protein